jgi:MULE transposase domain
MSSAGCAPREIITTLRQESSHLLLAKDVINVRQQQRHINLGGKTPIESLIAVLHESNWTFDYRTDTLGWISHLFFTHPQCIQLLNQFPDVLLLDCTYKTNKFKMPLLNIVGTSCLGKSFYVAFVFLAKEEEEDYLWALEQLRDIFEKPDQLKVTVTDCERALLNSLRTVFPVSARLLCIWHIEKNILVQATKYFKEEDSRMQFLQSWKEVMMSPSITAFEERWEKLQEDYHRDTPELISYLFNTWITFWKRLFIRAYADQHLYFGNRVTSRVERAHSKLKMALQVSTGDLKTVFEKIRLLLENDHMEHNGALAIDLTRIPHTARDPLYGQLIGRISNFALGKIWEQRHRLVVSEVLPPCTKSFSSSMGLPCAHQIEQRLRENQVLQLEDIHQHWYYNPRIVPTMDPLLLDPAIAQTRGRPMANGQPSRYRVNRATKARQTMSSTRRNPSRFEQVVKVVERTTRSGRKLGK